MNDKKEHMKQVDDVVFNAAFNELIKKEGGYVNHKNDPGGETKYGISKRTYPDRDIKNLTLGDARLIYYFDYWLDNKCHQMPEVIAKKYFDMCVNMGKNQATKLLQRALKAAGSRVTEDGILGPKTLVAVNKYQNNLADIVLSAMKSESAGYYRLLTQQKPDMKVFLNGWLNRAYC